MLGVNFSSVLGIILRQELNLGFSQAKHLLNSLIHLSFQIFLIRYLLKIILISYIGKKVKYASTFNTFSDASVSSDVQKVNTKVRLTDKPHMSSWSNVHRIWWWLILEAFTDWAQVEPCESFSNTIIITSHWSDLSVKMNLFHYQSLET